jgi:hypothetical protein
MTTQEKQAFKNVSEEDIIMCHFGWAVNMRNEFGMWEGNEDLIRSCQAHNPDDASMPIVKAVWEMLK